MRRAAATLVAVAVAGCGGGSSQKHAGPRPRPREGSDGAVIRAWSRALNREDYKRAASYFAPGAIVQQAEVFRLPDRRAALAFNQSLPCKADITDIKDKGATTLAAFRLREGPGGPAAACSGLARVRFRLRGGRFTEWRQLPERPQPEGKTA